VSDDISASLVVVPTLLTAKVALMPNICFPVADVRDVADIHVRAMTDPAAADERFIVCCDGGPITMAEAAYILRDWTGVNSLIKAALHRSVAARSRNGLGLAVGRVPNITDDGRLSTAGGLVRTGLVPAPLPDWAVDRPVAALGKGENRPDLGVPPHGARRSGLRCSWLSEQPH